VESIWTVLLLAALPAAGNFAGGLLAEFSHTPLRWLNRALHGAAGIIIAVIAVEIMPEALERIAAWIIALTFLLGAATYVLIERGVESLQSRAGQGSGKGMWMIYLAVGVDLFTDGILIGTGSVVSFSLALVLATGQVLADVPEGYATIANMKGSNLSRAKRLLLSAFFAVPVLSAAILAYYLLRQQSETWQFSVLVFAGGLLAVAAVEDMLSEAHENAEDTHWSVLAFASGFSLFVLVSAGLGSLVS